MAFVLKRTYEGYFYLFDEITDPRANDYLLLRSPIPTFIILFLWHKFVFEWGPEYMKNRPPFNPKGIMMVYNLIQVLANAYIVYTGVISANVIDWSCGVVDYSQSYWGRRFLFTGYLYFLLKLADLVDTVIFVLRKKDTHLSFLHTYHHFMMVILTFIGAKYVGGGHSYFLPAANSIVHTILYSYYLITSYDSRYGKLIWLKKSITLIQLAQFFFILWAYGKLLFMPHCMYPKVVPFVLVPQVLFMIILFSDFYVRTYILAPRRKKKLEEQERKEKEEQGTNHIAQ